MLAVSTWCAPSVSMTLDILPPPISRTERKQRRRRDAKVAHAAAAVNRKRRLWQLQLDKHRIPARKIERQWDRARQSAWLKILVHVRLMRTTERALQHGRVEARARRTSIQAANLLGNSWKSSYSKRKQEQHRRSSEILRERAWIARMNVRSRMRKNGSAMIRAFVISADEAGRFAYVVRTFRSRVLNVQRRLRAFLVVHMTRLNIMMRMFRQYEGWVARRLEREAREREQQAHARRMADLESRAKLARSAEAVAKARRGRGSGGTTMSRYLKEIDELGRNLDSVAFRMQKNATKVRDRAAARTQRRGQEARRQGKDDFHRVSKAAALSVLRTYLRAKRGEHYRQVQRAKRAAKRRMERLHEMNVENARQMLKHDLSLEHIVAEKRVLEGVMTQWPPIVRVFTGFKEALLGHLIEEAIGVQADMARRAREKALEGF